MGRTAGLAALASLFFIADCRRASALPVVSREQSHRGVRFLHLAVGVVDPAAPLLVALHGRGRSPEGFEDLWRDVALPLEIALPQAFERSGFGWKWFAWEAGMTDDEFTAAVSAAEERLWPAVVEAAHGRKIIVAGHSQGAVMAYVMAVRHPDEILQAFPISGGAPHKLLPRGHARTAPVYALHGTEDRAIGVAWARATIAEIRAAGGVAELKEFAGAGHSITPEMRRDLFAHLAVAATRDSGR